MAPRKKKNTDVDYPSYLQLDRLLTAQSRLSEQKGTPAHDEMLFIVVHQVYELWFKQILFEMDRIQKEFSGKVVGDKSLRMILSGLDRIMSILEILPRHMDILETMAPLDYLDFRSLFRTASGFQSMQFREFEIRLGVREEDRVMYANRPYTSYLKGADQRFVEKLQKTPSVFDQVEAWLTRTPFVEMGGYRFWDSYKKAVTDMLAHDEKQIAGDKELGDEIRAAEMAKLNNTRQQFQNFWALFGQKKPANDIGWRLSGKALQAALFVNLYRDQPVLQMPYRILSRLMDIDEIVTLWRYRHALMTQRMLGLKMGSGGTSGPDYLLQTAQKQRVFKDLFAITTFFIPRSKLPELPAAVEAKMGFAYSGK